MLNSFVQSRLLLPNETEAETCQAVTYNVSTGLNLNVSEIAKEKVYFYGLGNVWRSVLVPRRFCQ